MRLFNLLLLYPVFTRAFAPFAVANSVSATVEEPSIQPKVVAVAGATGRTGRLVVDQLLKKGVSNVIALVRDFKRAEEVFTDPPSNLQIIKCDLDNPAEIRDAIQQADAAIWCATGFSDAESSIMTKIKRLLGIALAPQKSIDAIGLPALAEGLNKMVSKGDGSPMVPKIVMCSSAGITRTVWDENKKKELEAAADIPIVRLNPFGILDIKRESEETLRQKCVELDVPYCIVRPTGLNDKWPAGSRPIFSQGDVAVGRINREDVATVLVDSLTIPEAQGKTFEVFALSGYPPAVDMGKALSRLKPDADGALSEAEVRATFYAMQQLLPGEQQDSAALAMGQTYEQLDEGETGRLGERGQEKAEEVAPKPSS